MNPAHPIYIVSKGRWSCSQTSLALDAMGVPHRVVIEEQEYDRYRVIGEDKLLILPKCYLDDYDTCDGLADVDAFAKLIGQTISKKQLSLWFPYMPPRRYADKMYIDKKSPD